ncbi:MAG: hypothetical protein K8S27_08975 [Candidatus Omnitrophica bacterium]|nr:hypothetical protein [Candidatus Omnitrophota bacterium]
MFSIFINKRKRRSYARRVIRSLLTIHLILSVIAFYRNLYLPMDRCAAVIFSDQSMMSEDVWASPLAQIGAYPYWSAYFNNQGMKTAWFHGSELSDLKALIDSRQFQQIVFLGEGPQDHLTGLKLKMNIHT